MPLERRDPPRVIGRPNGLLVAGRDGASLRLYDLFDEHRHVLLLLGDGPEAVPPAIPRYPENVFAAYRIVLEALTNVERHAHAHTCLVRLELPEAGVLCLDITDDGGGLPEHSGGGVGMTSMRERAAELGGECKITSDPTRGTRVWVRLPLAKE